MIAHFLLKEAKKLLPKKNTKGYYIRLFSYHSINLLFVSEVRFL